MVRDVEQKDILHLLQNDTYVVFMGVVSLWIVKQETEKKEQDAFDKWSKLTNKNRNLEKQIDKLNKKYTYTKKYKVKNPNYQEGGMPV